MKLFNINAYGHKVERNDIFSLIESHIDNDDWNSSIYGGDFHFVWNLDLDKTGGNPKLILDRLQKGTHYAETRFDRYLEGAYL